MLTDYRELLGEVQLSNLCYNMLMDDKSKFIKNLKGIPFDESRLDSDVFSSVKMANNLITQNKHKEASFLLLEDIKKEIGNITKETRDQISLKMLVISEIPDINDETRDLCLDIMISAKEGLFDKEEYNNFIFRINQIKTRC